MAEATNQNEQNGMNEGHPSATGEDPKSVRRKRAQRRRWFLLALVPVAAASALLLPRALAWGGWHGGLHHGFHRFGRGHCDLSQPEGRARLERRLTFVLEQLDADEKQQKVIRATVDRSLDEIMELHEKGHALRDRFGAALLGDKVDRAELEQARQQLRALADRGSRLAIERLAEICEVLTPEQRARIYDFIEAVHH